MTSPGFAYTDRFSAKLPPGLPRFTGFPKYNFIGGHNDPEQIPLDALAEAASAVIRREGSKLALYNLSHGPQGYRGLREFVAEKARTHRGIACTLDDVLITSGSGQGINLVNQLLLEAGDTVIVEEFSYGGALTKLRKLGVEIVAAPLDAHGIDMPALGNILADLKGRGKTPKYIYTIPTIQNPTGSILPLDRREGLIALARQYGVPIFEDECYADLLWTRNAPPALYALAPDQVIHIGSFSKSLAPALRVGYVVAPWDVLTRMLGCKADGGTGALDQMVVAEFFSRQFAPHVNALSDVLHEKLATMVDAVEKEFGTSVEMWQPEGGIFLWLKLPDGVDVTTLIKPAAEAGIVFNPGPEWACDPDTAKSHMRLCFALPTKAEIRDGVAALARVCHEQTGIPKRSGNVERTA